MYSLASIDRRKQTLSRRRALWVSVSTDLKFDAERDLGDLGVSPQISVYPRGSASLPTGSLEKVAKEGVMFCTYSLLAGTSTEPPLSPLTPPTELRRRRRLNATLFQRLRASHHHHIHIVYWYTTSSLVCFKGYGPLTTKTCDRRETHLYRSCTTVERAS